jgi:hypothetical protein
MILAVETNLAPHAPPNEYDLQLKASRELIATSYRLSPIFEAFATAQEVRDAVVVTSEFSC